ncbi:MAG: S-methyl-5-thioribose-1-phosphate isomerase [Candidatus Thermoplasmatota archaeon]|nr:S-methyl-5-thioribose-1-phosphate isomerase [Candidatus Thermoplasmatota archaeon]MBS3801371.1 S-methyl-5-thioribose-1-phosphate isomerase [Candidatus Thermoplasmatota archaeon]
MKIKGEDKKALWFENDSLYLIDQRKLPFSIEIIKATTVTEIAKIIKNMVVRGAPAIGATAAYGMVIGQNKAEKTANILKKTRPTAYDLFYAIDYMLDQINQNNDALFAAEQYVENMINQCKSIGIHGNKLIKNNMSILTHCNAGALATVDWGTALAPFRIAHQEGKQIFVYADETRPRLQGLLTSWELSQEKIPHAVIADNAAGYYMKKGDIDMVITGADRIAKNGDAANKIGTYEKAVLAKENNIPFYIAAPSSTFDTTINSGKDIIIEQRESQELLKANGHRIMPSKTPVKNPAFDVTPHRYITGFITEKGIKKR